MTEAINLVETARELIGGVAAKQPNHYLLSWTGTKVPRGASIDGIQIGWTQHGMVTGTEGEQWGYYERMMEFGGAEGRDQVIVISTTAKDVAPPAGGSVQKIDLSQPGPKEPQPTTSDVSPKHKL